MVWWQPKHSCLSERSFVNEGTYQAESICESGYLVEHNLLTSNEI